MAVSFSANSCFKARKDANPVGQVLGTSSLGNLGCHRLSTVFKALILKHPTSVEAECVELGPEIHPRQYEFPHGKPCLR